MNFSETIKYIYPLRIYYEVSNAFVISHDNQTLYIAYNAIHCIDLKNAKNLGKIYHSEWYICSMAISFDDSRLVAGNAYGEVLVFDTISLQKLNSFRNYVYLIQFIAFLPNSNEEFIVAYHVHGIE